MLWGDAKVMVRTQWPVGEEPLMLTLGAHYHFAPSGLFFPYSGWIAALSTLKKGSLAVSVIMMVVAGFFTLCAVLSVFLLQRVSGVGRADSKWEEAGNCFLPLPQDVLHHCSWVS